MTDSTSVKRGPYKRSAKRRAAIAGAVLAIVDEQGHESVTTALVAERSDTNEATVMYHFPTKEHLLVAALQLADELEADSSGATADQPHFDLASFAQAEPESEPRQRLLMMLRGQSATHGSPSEAFFRQRTSRAIEIFTRIIRQRQVTGEAHAAIDPEQAAAQFIAMWEGLALMTLLSPDFDGPAALIAGFERVTGRPLGCGETAAGR